MFALGENEWEVGYSVCGSWVSHSEEAVCAPSRDTFCRTSLVIVVGTAYQGRGHGFHPWQGKIPQATEATKLRAPRLLSLYAQRDVLQQEKRGRETPTHRK